MADQYAYPLDPTWSTEEMVSVLHFLAQVEQAYESQVSAEAVLQAYQTFKIIVPSKAQEKQIDRDFMKVSGYSTYQVLTKAREIGKGKIRIEK